MNTYYLILKTPISKRISLIKKCQAPSKIMAANIFSKRLENINKTQLFSLNELIISTKTEQELTRQEKLWIACEDKEFLEL